MTNNKYQDAHFRVRYNWQELYLYHRFSFCEFRQNHITKNCVTHVNLDLHLQYWAEYYDFYVINYSSDGLLSYIVIIIPIK